MVLSMKTKLLLFVGLLLLICLVRNSNAQTKTFPGELQDTTFVKKAFNENDSVAKYRQSHEFVYMQYLDSLLRKQKNIRSDTVSIDENSGRIVRHHSAQAEISGVGKVLNSLPLKIFFWTLAVIFIAFISYKVLFKNGILVRRKNKLIPENYESLIEDLDDISKYDALISDAETRNDLNLATRYLFLKTLKTLADKELIHFTAEKTNKEYIRELQQNYYSSEFQHLVRDYEYAWYGKFSVDKNKYEHMKEAFTSFNQKV
jgi:hypothetical protein